MNYLLDTDCCVYLLTNRFEALARRVAACEEGSIGISAVTFAELALGSAVGKPPPSEMLDAFLQEIPLLDFDRSAAAAYARLPFKRGRFDRLIAAHALSLGLTLITNNQADFVSIPELITENWTR